MKHIHWIGAGLSSSPGVERLITLGYKVSIWNRTLEKAEHISRGRVEARQYSIESLLDHLESGDIVVSMLPAMMHLELAIVCTERSCHFVCSSYLTSEMEALHEKARLKGLSIVTEVGLDPGLDHILAHILISESSKKYAEKKKLNVQFRSFCGGLPKIPGDFCYKFSWSPLGVLKALKSEAKWIEGEKVCTSSKPRMHATTYVINLEDGIDEEFEVFPNRNSLNYIDEYHLPAHWHKEIFIRGTLRNKGWSSAWKNIFDQIESSDDPDVLIRLSNQLTEQYMFTDTEQDRVVLVVELCLKDGDGQIVYLGTLSLNVFGLGRNTAMAKLVSLPVSFAVEDILQNVTPVGVSKAPDDPRVYKRWIKELENLGIHLRSTVVVEETA